LDGDKYPAIVNILDACEDSGEVRRNELAVDLDPYYEGIPDVIARVLLPSCETTFLGKKGQNTTVSRPRFQGYM